MPTEESANGPSAADANRTDAQTISLWRTGLAHEIDSAALYRTLSDIESSEPLAELYGRMAATEERHASRFREKLLAAGAGALPAGPSRRARILAWLARRWGPGFVLPTLIGREQADAATYESPRGAQDSLAAADERSHARLLGLAAAGRGVAGGAIARFEGRHRMLGGNALRAAVLGANDGLVSNLSLVMGVAGAELGGQSILVTGLAGLIAGAGSMALGEWLSVASSRELYRHQLAIEREELATSPEEEEAELALIFRAKGLGEAESREVAAGLVADPVRALDTLAREELAIDPEGLGGSAWEAALTSFLLFAVGAVVPVAPYAFWSGAAAVGISVALSGLALFALGAAITLMTGRSALVSGLRQLAIGLLAALLTWGVGRLIGVSLAG